MDATIVTYQQFLTAAPLVYASGMKAIYLDSQPGTGKTASGAYIQQKLGLKHRFIIKPGHHDPIDFQGLPVPDHTSKMSYFYPSGDLLPPPDLEGGCLVILDEMSDSPQMVQNLCCQWVYEDGLHSYRNPPNTVFLLTGNRVADRSGAQRVVTKLGNRVAWFTLAPTVDELFDYGVSQGWNPTVLAFLKLRGGDPINPNDRSKEGRIIPTYFNSFDTSDPAQSIKPVFASSRSWEFTSNLMNYIDEKHPKIDDGTLLTMAASLVGTPVATALVPFRSEAQHMPDPAAILRGDKVAFPKKQSVLWTLTISLVSRVTKDTWSNMDTWLKQGPAEFRILAVRMAFDTKAAKLIGPAFNATLQEPDVKQAITSK